MKRTVILSFDIDCPLTFQELAKLKIAMSETLADMEFNVSSEEIKCFEER